MQVINYKCTLCENVWEEDLVFGIYVHKDGAVNLIEPSDSEKHVCRNCMIAIDTQVKGDSQGDAWQEGRDED